MKRRQAQRRFSGQTWRHVPRAALAAALVLLGGPAVARPHLMAPPAHHRARRPRRPKAERVEKGPEANARYVAKAKELLGENKDELAFHQFDDALIALPDDVQTLEDYGRALYAHGRLQEAAERFKRITEVAKDQPVAVYNLAYAQQKLRDYPAAAASFQQYLALVPDDPDALYNLAECLRAQGENAQAAADYEAYAQQETRPEDASFVAEAKAKAESLRGGGSGVVASSRPESVTTLSSTDPTPKTATETVTSEPTLAERAPTAPSAPTAAAAAAPPAAVAPTAAVASAPSPLTAPAPSSTVTAAIVAPAATAADAAAAPPTSAPAPTAVAAPAGGLLAGSGLGTSPAVAAAPKPDAYVSERDPTAAISKIREGDQYFNQKRYREALFAYQDAVKLDDQSVNGLLKMGLAYANLNYFKEAIEKWQRVLELDPNDRYAKAYITRAQERLNQSPNTPPSDQPRPVGLGSGLATGGEEPAAPAAPARVSEADRTAARAAYRRAVADMGQGQFPQAIQELTLSIQRDPGFINAWVARGGAYLGARSYDESASDYRKSLQLDPTLATPLYGLGRVYDKLGDRAKACDFYRRYGHSTGRDAQQRLQQEALAQASQLCG